MTTAMTRLRHALPDLAASIVVFLIAVPLSMGIALASGAPILSGLIAAAVGGIVVGLLGGAPLQVSGPAAGLAVLVFGFVQSLGWAAMGFVVIGAGALQVVLGLARVARAALAISPAVIHGMLAGIGVQIALAQLHVMLGGAPQSSALANLAQLPAQIADIHTAAAFLGVLTIAIVVGWPFVPARLVRLVPPALVAVTVATVLSLYVGADVPRVVLPTDWSTAFTLPVIPAGRVASVAFAAATLALVASAESLLCAVATDKLHSGPRARLDRELVAQGVANVASGLAGGLPVSGVIVRSTANITAGARTRLSAILHGVWVVLAMTSLGFILTKIPLAALAALLVVVGTKLVKPSHIREFAKHGEASTYLITLTGVVALNLLAGIAIGIGWAAIRLLRSRSKVEVEVTERGERIHIVITGALTFLGVPKLLGALSRVPEGKAVDVDLAVDMIDHAGFDALHTWRSSYEKVGGTVDLDQLHEAWPLPRRPRGGALEPA